jgi:hypothetical protein
MQRVETLVAVALTAFGLAVAYYAREHLKLGHFISPGAGFIPFAVGIILAALGVAWFVAVLLAGRGRLPETGGGPGADQPAPEGTMLSRFVPGVLLIVAYAWLFERAGFFLSTLLFMVSWQKVVERESWLKTALIAIVCSGAMWALFSFLLKGVLPTGAWFG